MCGIAGYFSKNNFFSTDNLYAMANAIKHRGPDAEGFFFDEVIGLGHRRLSIIDLSENGNQPIHSHNNRYAMVYNGEVYNYPDIATEIKLSRNSSVKFNSTSDTEIILEAFVEWGVDFVDKLNGMFAIAIYDKQEQELFVFRDRLGIKPLYYFWNGGDFAFSSELKSLALLNQIGKEINNESVYYYLHTGFIPAPNSIYKNVKKLSPGCYLHISKKGINIEKYWDLKSHLKTDVVESEKNALIRLSDLLTSSVQFQMRSDVPFGIFLSGGIDSSLIAAMAVNLSRGVGVNTFSIGFEENRFNESKYAKSIAKYLRTNHHEFILSHKDAIDLIDKIFYAYDEPFADSSAIPTMLVSKMARQHVTVALSGDGGDELFFGYGSYLWAKRLNNPLIELNRKPIAYALNKLSNKYKRAALMFQYPDKREVNSHILSQEQYFFSRYELDKLMSKPFDKIISNILDISNWTYNRKLTEMEKQAMFDLYYYLPADLLTKVDRASMQYSLEARVPYLDHRIVEFAINISPQLKFKNNTPKYLLKEILYQYIPEKFFDRPKQGFAVPIEDWLKKDLLHLIHDNLSKENVERYNLVNFEQVNFYVKEFLSGKSYYYNRVWSLILLHDWLKKSNA
ncbi:MAG: asparagine synthase (glutamine-hydrolyzing) [Bacteroidota bacterium]